MSAAGTALLVGTLLAGVVGAVAWAGATPGTSRPGAGERVGGWAMVLAAALSAAAVVLLEVALLRHDTSLAYVAQVAGPDLAAYYRATSLWSALEGSLLLWLVILASTAALSLRGRRAVAEGTYRWAAAVLCLLVAAFAVVALMASPFALASPGAPPSPLLQDHVAMGLHPPLLYAGFAALAVPYALTVGGLAARSIDHTWANLVRGWNLAAWVLLTLGVLLGAWWSYAVLGWGGYWAWDPVENASLMPWLTASALLHAVGLRTRTGAWRGWATVLAGAGFVLVLLATFLTRSGVVESIHAFTTSPLGPVLLAIVLVALLPWVALVVHRRADLAAPPTTGVLTRAAVLQANHVLLVLITVIVLVGTVLPTVLQAVTGERVSVGPPWYQRTLAPVALILLLVMAVGPWVSRRRQPAGRLLRSMLAPAAAALVAVGLVGLAVPDAWFALATGIAVFVLVSLLLRGRRDRRGAGALLAHLGVAVAALAVLAGGHGTIAEETVPVGGTVAADGVTVTLVQVHRYDEGPRSVAEAELLLGEDGRLLGTARPQLRWYDAESSMLAGPDIRTELLRDVYVTLLDVDPESGAATVRLAVTPLVGWLWAAGTMTALGGLVVAWPARRRATGPRPPEQTAAVPAGAVGR